MNVGKMKVEREVGMLVAGDVIVLRVMTILVLICVGLIEST